MPFFLTNPTVDGRWLLTTTSSIVVLLQYCHTHAGLRLASSVEHPSDLCWYGSYYPVDNAKELQGGLSLLYASVACFSRSPNPGVLSTIRGGVPPELLADYEDSTVAFFFGRHGFFCIIRNPEDDENLLCLRVQNVTGASIRRMHRVTNPPEDFTDAAYASRKDYRLYIVSDVVIPNHFALALINADTFARFNTWSDLRLRYLPRTAVAELIQKATPFPKFVNNFYCFPWVDGVSIGPGHTAEIADGAYIYFHPYNLLGKAITLVDFERPFSLSRNRRVRRSVPFLTIAEPVPLLAIMDIAPNRPITPRPSNLNAEGDLTSSHTTEAHLSGGAIDDIPFIRQSAQIQRLAAQQQCIRFPVFNLHCAIPRDKWFYYLLGSNHFLQNSDGDTTMFVCYLADYIEIRGVAKLTGLDLNIAFFNTEHCQESYHMGTSMLCQSGIPCSP